MVCLFDETNSNILNNFIHHGTTDCNDNKAPCFNNMVWKTIIVKDKAVKNHKKLEGQLRLQGQLNSEIETDKENIA